MLLIYLGDSGKTSVASFPDTLTLAEHNLFDRTGCTSASRTEGKSCTVRYNTILGPSRISGQECGRLQNRNGHRSRWIGNYCQNSRGILVHGSDHQVSGNKLAGTKTRLDVFVGTNSSPPSNPTFDGVFAGNKGATRVGFEYFKDGVTIIPASRNRIISPRPSRAMFRVSGSTHRGHPC